jgi:lipopolysaccharide export system permease protein
MKEPISSAVMKRTYKVNFSNPRENRTWQIGKFNQLTPEMSEGVIVMWKLADNSSRWLEADRAVFTNDAWTFYSVQVLKVDPDHLPLPTRLLETNVLTVQEFHETPEQMKSEIRIGARISVLTASRADIPIVEILSYLHHHETELTRTDKNWLYTKLQGRLAAPWSCMVVVLMAVSFGAASGRRNIFTGIASSISICFAYFILLQVGLALGVGGKLVPWVAAWMPNIVFGLTGIYLTARVR